MEKVSVIIPSYNRFNFLKNTLNSIKQQTYPYIEIIVVNDGSTESDYYSYNWENQGIKIIHLEENSKIIFGFASPGYVRNKGIEIASGDFIAFCDDDDIWFPNKISYQINAMKKYKCGMSSTDGFIGNGLFNKDLVYNSYQTFYFKDILLSFKKKRKSNFLIRGLPKIWTYNFLRIHNCVVCSSAMVKKDILNRIGNFKTTKPPGEDYETWLEILKYTNCVYLSDICFYYDTNHGNGQNY